MSLKPVSEDDLYRSYKKAVSFLEKEHKDGKITREKLKSLLDGAKRNYKNQTYNRQLDALV